MATIQERLAILETNVEALKLNIKGLQRAIWILVLAVIGDIGVEYLPIVL